MFYGSFPKKISTEDTEDYNYTTTIQLNKQPYIGID